MNRFMTVIAWTLLIVGGWGFWIVLLASPVNAAIWADANMWAPWDHQAKWRWAMGLGAALKASWGWLAAMGACLAMAFAGGRLRRVAEVRRITGRSEP
jgi:hypothetical protein